MSSNISFKTFASVLVDLALDKPLDYGIPSDLSACLQTGSRVKVPLRGKTVNGFVVEIKHSSAFSHVHSIQEVVMDGEFIPPDLFELALWMSKYYCSPLRRVLKILLPAVVRKDTKHKEQLYVMRNKTKEELRELCEQLRNTHSPQAAVLDVMLQVKKGILLSELLEKTEGSRSPLDSLVKKGALVVDIVRVDRSPLMNEEYFRTQPKILTAEQNVAFQAICKHMDEEVFATHLLYGITGSGKTEIYLQAIDKALKAGKGAIVLVPEITLTTQMIERFRSRFEGHIAVLHHRLSQGERFDEWHRIRRGEARVVIGARSAVFSPVKNLGLIVVDEEHESSYKQAEESPSYHARDVAVMRGKITKSVILLGSATPSLESFDNAKKGKYTLSVLSKRAAQSVLPSIEIVDMKFECEKAKRWTHFSEKLLDGIEKRITKGEQTLLFLNRRGYHTSLFCTSCGHVVQCKNCDISLTFHKGENCLSCHLCGYSLNPPPTHCPLCKHENPMKFRGAGTEQVEKALHAIFPDVRTIRMDGDTTKHKGSHQKLLRDFGSGKADVLIGTQMIAKGLHFPQVTLVGVLNSDGSLQIPDFRASETVFQIITQVAGRAGRGETLGEVIIQSFMPDNRTIVLASQQDYENFFKEEMETRKMFNYPPFKRLVKIALSGPGASATFQIAEQIRGYLMQRLPADYELQPVIPAGYAKVKGLYRYQFIVKGKSSLLVSQFMEEVQKAILLPKKTQLFVDVDPSTTYF